MSTIREFILIPEGFGIFGGTKAFSGTLEEAQEEAIGMATRMPLKVYDIQTDESLPVRRIVICEVVGQIVSEWKVAQPAQV